MKHIFKTFGTFITLLLITIFVVFGIGQLVCVLSTDNTMDLVMRERVTVWAFVIGLLVAGAGADHIANSK